MVSKMHQYQGGREEVKNQQADQSGAPKPDERPAAVKKSG